MRLAVCTAGGLCGPGSLNENQELGWSCLVTSFPFLLRTAS